MANLTYRVVDMSNSANYGDGTVWCDTKADLALVPTDNLEQGTMAYIQSGTEKGNVYSLLSTKVWEKQ